MTTAVKCDLNASLSIPVLGSKSVNVKSPNHRRPICTTRLCRFQFLCIKVRPAFYLPVVSSLLLRHRRLFIIILITSCIQIVVVVIIIFVVIVIVIVIVVVVCFRLASVPGVVTFEEAVI